MSTLTPTQKELAQIGLSQIKQAMLDLLAKHSEGLTNIELADALGLRSDFEGGNRNYLSWSILGLLVNEGAIHYSREKNRRVYHLHQLPPKPTR